MKIEGDYLRVTDLDNSLPLKQLETIKKHFGKNTFSRQSLLEAIAKDHGDLSKTRLRLASWTVNSIEGYEFSQVDDSWHKRHKLLYMRSENLFEMYSPLVHGEWTRSGNECHRIR